MTHLETRPFQEGESKRTPVSSTREDINVNHKIDYYMEFVTPSQKVTEELLSKLDKISSSVIVVFTSAHNKVWFPQHITELHRCCTTLFKYGHELAPDHPGYGDGEYEKRRKEIAEISKNYK